MYGSTYLEKLRLTRSIYYVLTVAYGIASYNFKYNAQIKMRIHRTKRRFKKFNG